MQQALEALEKATRFMSDSDYKKLNQAIDDLRAALAEPENQNQSQIDTKVNPAEREQDTDCHLQGVCQRSGYSIANTPRRPLTDEEIIEHFEAEVDTGLLSSFADGVRFAERAHGIKGEQT
jgi:hypothetical protein